MTEQHTARVEATGETVGEAKWAALRELEHLAPGLERESVEFEIISEGERGLLGVGYLPARVVASAPVSNVDQPEPTPAATAARAFVDRVAAAIGAAVSTDVVESDDTVTVMCRGADLGLLIGSRGQTIDAIQYLANALARAAGGEQHIVVDAAGYRARRAAALESAALESARRAVATRQRVELEPMTPVERKIVHEALKDDPEVETSSEGSEPNRYVVVAPRLAVD